MCQIVRVLTEDWCARELYCPSCNRDNLIKSKANSPSIDFICDRCGQTFQLKGSKRWQRRKVVDAGYNAMLSAIRGDRAPNLLVLHYSPGWFVQNLLLIPHTFLAESMIEKRNPLRPTARRAGWIGCNILLGRIPNDGKISVISEGTPTSRQHVVAQFARAQKLAPLRPAMRGWTVDVMSTIGNLGKSDFALSELYEHERELQLRHPENRNVRPKIRQQLQVLRDLGLLRFVSPGHYSLL